MKFEFPLIVEVDADSREEAEEKASDLADSIGEVFQTQATAVITTDHNLLEQLRINPAGVS